MIQRVAAIILRGKKVLMVSGGDYDFYWTPGGEVDKGEALEEALVRELNEELGIKPANIKKYISYPSYRYETNEPATTTAYFVDYEGDLKPNNEVEKLFWYSRENFGKKSPKLFPTVESKLIPKLIEDNLI